jgi:hypothetical protein
MTVYITQDSKYNYADATRFGDVKIVCDADFPLEGFSVQADVVTTLKDRLANFNPKTDKLVLLGDPILIGICFSIVAQKHREIPILKWDRRQSLYKPATIYL